MNLVDGVFIFVLAWGAYQGFSRGLISMVCHFGGFIAGIWVAGLHYISVAKFFGIRLGLMGLMTKKLNPFFVRELATEGFPQSAQSAGSALGEFPPSLWEPVYALQSGITGPTSAQLTADGLVKLFSFFLVFALVFFVLGFFLRIVGKLVTKFARIILLGGVNRAGGLALGLGTNALFLVIVVGMVTPLLYILGAGFPEGGFGTALVRHWDTSILMPYLNESWGLASWVLASCFQMV